MLGRSKVLGRRASAAIPVVVVTLGLAGLSGCSRPQDVCIRPVLAPLLQASTLTAAQRASAFAEAQPLDPSVHQSALDDLSNEIGDVDGRVYDWRKDPRGAFAAETNRANASDYCRRLSAYRARRVQDGLQSVAQGVIAQCGNAFQTAEVAESNALADVLTYRSCASGTL